jgi:adenine-specific DNA-methyltransferase
MRPEVGTQAQFKKKKPPQTYRYDSSLSPSLEWDGQNPAREAGETLIKEIAECGQKLAELSKQPASPERDQEIANRKSQIVNAQSRLRQISGAFLNWSGKAERLSFDVPTLPLFIHERLSTKAIIETLKGHKTDKQEDFFRELWGDPQHSVTDQVLRAYEYRDDWVNRMMLGDSLVAMNSLLRYESLGGQVQMIYIDPPYGVKFGSNFQPFVRKRDVAHNDDGDMTREPEMVQAYRDTWELGLHSYLTYLRDRLLLARELLHPSGSIFVQISDENLHHVREVMDEVFGDDNFIAVINFATTTGSTREFIGKTCDYLLFYAKDRERLKFRPVFRQKGNPGDEESAYSWIELNDGTRRRMTAEEREDPRLLPQGARIFTVDNLQSQSMGREKGEGAACWFSVELRGRKFTPNERSRWKTNKEGMANLKEANRLEPAGDTLRYVRYFADFPFSPCTNLWDDTTTAGYSADKLYVVQTNQKVIQRCLLMTTDPGDLVLDPTCGSGTTAYVAEQWGRRWITCDTSRVPLALARQRLLTATFPFYEINPGGAHAPSRAVSGAPPETSASDDSTAPVSSARAPKTAREARALPETALPNNPAAGFVYKRKQNNKGEEIGGIVPHITLKSIANNEPPAEEVLVDRPEVKSGIIRVTGPFTFEATIPTPVELAGEKGGKGEKERVGAGSVSSAPSPLFPSASGEDYGAFVDRMLEVLRKSPVLRLEGNRTVQLKNIRPPARSLALSAEAVVGSVGTRSTASQTSFGKSRDAVESVPTNNEHAPVAIVFGPENGAVSEKLVYEAAREAHAKNYTHLYVIGFAIQPNARALIEKCSEVMGVPATYVQATPDLMMGDLLKNMRSSQIFSVCGLPEVKLSKVQNPKSKVDYKAKAETQYQVELLGLDVFDPISMEVDHQSGNDVPAWLLDTDYNGLCFHVTQAFFPKTGAWENLKKALKGDYEESVWDHLAGTVSAPFAAGEHGQIAVKVIDQRGNELLVVKSLKEAGK